jgi:hypothetical protein
MERRSLVKKIGDKWKYLGFIEVIFMYGVGMARASGSLRILCKRQVNAIFKEIWGLNTYDAMHVKLQSKDASSQVPLRNNRKAGNYWEIHTYLPRAKVEILLKLASARVDRAMYPGLLAAASSAVT